MSTSQKPPPVPGAPRRLADVLRAIPATELNSLVARLGIPIDAQKRLDASAQVARALVALPEVRDPSLLPPASAELLRRIAEARGSLLTTSLPQAVEPLAARGVVFARRLGEGVVELLLPTAYVVQLKSWEGEDPRGVRALLAQASFETLSAIASHYLGRPATPPLALALEPAWEVLANPARLEEEVARLAPAEKRLLESVEREGGEVETEELLDLEREPMRLRTASGATPSRRGAGFALERRGFLIPLHPNRYLVPSEVAAVIGAEQRAERASRRADVRQSVLGGDYHPRRARFAEDPSAVVLAMALAMRAPASEVRAGIGTPRSLVMRLGQRFGRDPERVTLLGALSRAAGLWEGSALTAGAPPGSWHASQLAFELFSVWRRGGAWDEARPDAEVFRVAADARDASPIGTLRDMVLDALRDLGEGRWVPWNALAGYVRDDARTAGVARLLRRWSERAGVPNPSPLDVVKRIVFETLPSLGVLDLGDVDEVDRAPAAAGDEVGAALRLTPRGRVLVSGSVTTSDPTPSHFERDETLVVGSGAPVAAVLALAPFVEIGEVTDKVALHLSTQTVARALSAGVEPEVIKARIAALTPLPEPVAAVLAQASTVLARVTYAPAAGFVWVDDSNVRDLLASRRQTTDLFVNPSPPGGLLLAPGVDIDRVVRSCRSLGVEILHEGQTMRTRGGTPTPGPVGTERRTRSSASMKRSDS